MTSAEYDRLVAFFYLLTRGTPHHEGLAWGSVKGILRELPAEGTTSVFTSAAGVALAREIVEELLASPSQPSDSPAETVVQTELGSVEEIGQYFTENDYPCSASTGEGNGVFARFDFDCGPIATLYKSGKAQVQGKGSDQQKADIKELLRATHYEVA